MKPKKQRKPRDYGVCEVDEHCQLVVPFETAAVLGFKVGDEFFAWGTREKIQMVFPHMSKRRKVKIPKNALHGTVGGLDDNAAIKIDGAAKLGPAKLDLVDHLLRFKGLEIPERRPRPSKPKA